VNLLCAPRVVVRIVRDQIAPSRNISLEFVSPAFERTRRTFNARGASIRPFA
jgi:hypothetical protein